MRGSKFFMRPCAPKAHSMICFADAIYVVPASIGIEAIGSPLGGWPLPALCGRWRTTQRMGEDAPIRSFPDGPTAVQTARLGATFLIWPACDTQA